MVMRCAQRRQRQARHSRKAQPNHQLNLGVGPGPGSRPFDLSPHPAAAPPRGIPNHGAVIATLPLSESSPPRCPVQCRRARPNRASAARISLSTPKSQGRTWPADRVSQCAMSPKLPGPVPFDAIQGTPTAPSKVQTLVQNQSLRTEPSPQFWRSQPPSKCGDGKRGRKFERRRSQQVCVRSSPVPGGAPRCTYGWPARV